MIIGWIGLGIGLALLAVSAWYFVVSLGYRKGRTVRARAYLQRTEYKNHIDSHDRQGRFVRSMTRARYVYTVGGRTYSIDDSAKNADPGMFPSVVRVIYQRSHPGRAYLEKRTPCMEPILCGAFAFLGLLFAGLGLAVVFS